MAKTDGFASMVDDAVAFFSDLDANNTKEWFEPRKEHYQKAIRQPAELLSELVADAISQLTGVGHSGKVYRIHRDVRFSKDKRPYNTHLHMLWSAKSAGEGAPAWFFACSPTMLTVNMGCASLKGEQLTRYRKMIDDHGDELQEALHTAGLPFSSWGEEPLKKTPAPYGDDHPHAAMLKRRSLILDAPLGQGWRSNGDELLTAIHARCVTLKPVWDILHDHLG